LHGQKDSHTRQTEPKGSSHPSLQRVLVELWLLHSEHQRSGRRPFAFLEMKTGLGIGKNLENRNHQRTLQPVPLPIDLGGMSLSLTDAGDYAGLRPSGIRDRIGEFDLCPRYVGLNSLGDAISDSD
jgi:hypothetical protein